MARARKASAEPSGNMPVEVDPNFVRVFADQALVMNLGRDIDFAFLTIGAKLERVQRSRGGEDPDRMRMRPQLNEVVRVRMAPVGAAGMSVDVLTGLISAGLVDKKGLIATLDAIEEPDLEVDPDDDEQPEEVLSLTQEGADDEE